MQKNGFTLIEVAIVLVVVGLLLGGLLPSISVQVEQSRRISAMDMGDNLQEAIIGFVISERRLPCPDVNGDGQEDPPGGVGGCTSDVGELPAVTLGVIGEDAWKQSWIYLVDAEFADDTDGTTSGCGSITTGVSFELCASGDIQIDDSASSGNPIATNVPVVWLSQAKNWQDTAVGDEAENNDGDRNLVYSKYRYDFDDLVFWLPSTVLRNRMVTAGILP